jgi:hypothetical protein
VRLADYLGQRDSAFMDEPATARALADFVLRGVDCGAVAEAAAVEKCGASQEDLARLARRT